MDEEQMERAVLAYLKKKGYRNAELAFKDEARVAPLEELAAAAGAGDVSIANSILFYNRSDSNPQRYREGYAKLRAWVHASLDLYKTELLHILYPVFVHAFLELVSKGYPSQAREFFGEFKVDHERVHLRDLQKLEGVTDARHLQENGLVHTFRDNKFNVKLCQYSFNLLLQLLQGAELMLILSIVNEHVNLQVLPGQVSAAVEEEDSVAFTGKESEQIELLNQKEIQWGALEGSIEHKYEKEVATQSQGMDGMDIDTEDSKQKRSADGLKLGPKKAKRDKDLAAGAKPSKADGGPGGPSTPRVRPNLPMPKLKEEVEKALLDDLRRRIRLSAAGLPSVCFYTFVNTNHGLNCVGLTQDGALVAGGFSDASIKVWSMARSGGASDKLLASPDDRSRKTTAAPPAPATAGEAIQKGSKARGYTLLQGHSGPVYATCFSLDSSYLLSSSADCTVRLWSMELNTNLASYKGHNYPVWDVQFSPVGLYFASASHDRTARLWSMERSQPLRIMAGHLSDVDCVRWHVNCNYIATGSSDKTVRLWDVQSGECMRIFAGHRGSVLSLAMSPDGRFMASGDEDGAIMVWDLGSGRRVTPLLGHTACVWSLAFSGEGSLLASGSADNTVRLWDVSGSTKAPRLTEKGNAAANRRLRLVKTLPTKSTPVYALQFTRRNLLLASGAFTPPKPSPQLVT
eukprot:SM000014S00302  [mRNA]  locus=s14:546230:551448:- [translate_table: standard]